MIWADSHTHSHLSFDGSPEATPDRMCRIALEKGLTHLCITDHCDVNGPEFGYAPLDEAAADREIPACRDEFRGRLDVGYGIELGEAAEHPDRASAILGRHDYDFVLGSLHNLKGCVDFSFIRFDHPGFDAPLIDRLYERMLRETEELLSFPGINALAHLTYMERYVRRAGKTVPEEAYADLQRHIFRTMTERGIALELNVSPIARGEETYTMPGASLLKLYRECGGEMVTVGSDAHRPEQIGAGVREGYRMLREAGFRYVTVFRSRKPVLYPLD